MGLFGGKQSQAQATGASNSGIGAFSPTNKIYMGNAPIVDFSNPVEIAALGGLVLLGWLAWKRLK